MFENPRRGRQARNFTTNVPKILDLKSSSEQIFSRKLPLGAPAKYKDQLWNWQKKQTRKKRNRSRESKTRRRWSTPVSTATGIGPSFFKINIFLIIIIELSKLKFGKWSEQMLSFSSFRAFYAPSMDQKPKKGTLGFMSPGSPRSLLPRPLL